ncbi:MAG: ankyrin repeat domain-containing protein [Parachlamydiaceae bacterium]|nr:ankyrin repeat domain-containing protein [Parachlamydiaceae bacterium]
MIPSIKNSEASLINPLGAKLSTLRRRELDLLCRIDSIGSEMRESISLIVEIAEAKLVLIRDLLALNPENRDFTRAENQFKCEIERRDRENVECYQNLLDARSSYMQSGVEVQLTPEKKQELILLFKNVVKNELSQAHLNIDAETDLKQLEKRMEEEIKTHLSIFQSLLDNKTLLGMEFEKTTIENDQIDKIKSQLYIQEATNIWQASEMGDLGFLTKQIDLLWFFQVSDFVNQKNAEGQTMLALASAHGHLDCLIFLLSNKADPNIPDKHGYRPLHWSAKSGRMEITKELIRFGADVNALGEYRRTPLNMAAFDGQVAICELLLSKGADINARTDVNGGGLAVLHTAVMREHKLVVEALIKIPRLDVNLLDSSNHSPLYYAVLAGCPDIAAFIVSHLSWKCPKDLNDPNHMNQLSKLIPNKNPEQISRFLSHFL